MSTHAAGWALGALAAERVELRAELQNRASQRVAEKAGFVREGVLRHWHLHRGEPRDVTILRLLREEWQAGPLASVPVTVED